MNFDCPMCDGSVEKIDDRFFRQERIQGSDALNADPFSRIDSKIELWYCYKCAGYFRAYYTLEKIIPLTESENELCDSADKKKLCNYCDDTGTR